MPVSFYWKLHVNEQARISVILKQDNIRLQNFQFWETQFNFTKDIFSAVLVFQLDMHGRFYF